MKSDTSINPMVEPQYSGNAPTNKIRLSGRILVFGSGQLTHERRFFSFDKKADVVLYDPFQRTNSALLNVKKIPPPVNNLEEALSGRSFDAVLCLFSLHFEPQWLFTLEKVLKQLKRHHAIYFAEDKGFRALLDNNSSLEVLQSNEPNKKLGEIISAAFRQRETQMGAHWLPDISASDYGSVFEILSLVGERTTQQSHILRRGYDATNEPNCYLPWNMEANPALTPALLAEFKAKLPQNGKVTEVVKITGFRKDRDLPNLHDVDGDLTRTVWHCISRRASERIGKVRALPPAEKPEDASKHREQFAKTFLHTAYLNFFRHFGSISTAEVVIGFHSNFGSDHVNHDLTFDPHLPPCVFSSFDRRLSMKYETPEFLERYITGRKNAGTSDSQPKFVAHELCDRGEAGIFLWGPPKDPWWPQRKDTLAVKTHLSSLVDLRTKEPETKQLFDVCTKWHVPLCLYMLGSLGYAASADAGLANKEKIAAACVVYFFQNPDYRSDRDAEPPAKYKACLMDDADVLIFASPGIISPLAGLSAYLELAHKEGVLESILKTHPDLIKKINQKLLEASIDVIECGDFQLSIEGNKYGALKKGGTSVERLAPKTAKALKYIFENHGEGGEFYGTTCVEGIDSTANTKNYHFNKLFDSTSLWKNLIVPAKYPDGRIRKGQYCLNVNWKPTPRKSRKQSP